jgi:predicted RNase H-like nuclease
VGTANPDQAARQLLAPHQSRVFLGARRSILACTTHADAHAHCKQRGEPGVSAQLFCLSEKLREIDAVMTPALQDRLMESHPEVVFRRLYGFSLPKKKTAGGQAIRRDLLRRAGFCDLDSLLDARKGTGAKADDILDACACAVAARDFAHRLPQRPALDARRLRMEVNY